MYPSLMSLQDPSGRGGGAKHLPKKSITVLQTLFTGQKMSLDVPLATIRSNKRESTTQHEGIDEETERHL